MSQSCDCGGAGCAGCLALADLEPLGDVVRVVTDESLLPDEWFLIADPEEFARRFCGEVERAWSYYRLMLLIGSVDSLRREALGETCPSEARTVIKRHIADLLDDLKAQQLPVGGSATLETVRLQAERVVGQPCLTRYAADGQSIEIVSPVINEQEVQDG